MTAAMSGSGALSADFTHVIFKRLSAVEADSSRSNQHEFNAPKQLKEAFGRDQPRKIKTDFVWMPDGGDFIISEGHLTWYDARARHPVRSEYRLYYRNNAVTEKASGDDLLLIAVRPSGKVLLIIAPGSGTAAARISWLFGIEAAPASAFAALAMDASSRQDLARRFGTVADDAADSWAAALDMKHAASDASVRAITMSNQNQIGTAQADDQTSWDDIDLELPEQPGPNGGAGGAT